MIMKNKLAAYEAFVEELKEFLRQHNHWLDKFNTYQHGQKELTARCLSRINEFQAQLKVDDEIR